MKLRGLRASIDLQTYIWEDPYLMSSVGRGMLASLPIQSRGGADPDEQGDGERGKLESG